MPGREGYKFSRAVPGGHMIQYLKELSHNLVIHPLVGVFPFECMYDIHDRNAEWVWPEEEEE